MQSSDIQNNQNTLLDQLKKHKTDIEGSKSSYREEAKKQKLTVLNAAIAYLSGSLSHDELSQVVLENPKYDDSLGFSQTKKLIKQTLNTNINRVGNHVDINKVFANFPNEEYWKLIIDQMYWQFNDPHYFDKQQSKNYLKNTGNALLYSYETVNDPVTVPLIIKLHDFAYHEKDSSILGLQESPAASGFTHQSSSVDGLVQMIEQIKNDPNEVLSLALRDPKNDKIEKVDVKGKDSHILAHDLLNESKQNNLQILLYRKNLTADEIRGKMQSLIGTYEAAIKVANSKNQPEKDTLILKAIVNFIQDIHQFHPFKDGNGRTFIFLLLNKLLMMNGLSPAAVEMPARFTGYSREELLTEVIKGQKHFKALCNTSKKQSFLDFLRSQFGSHFEANTLFGEKRVERSNQIHEQQIQAYEKLNLLKSVANEVNTIIEEKNQAVLQGDENYRASHILKSLQRRFTRKFDETIAQCDTSFGPSEPITFLNEKLRQLQAFIQAELIQLSQETGLPKEIAMDVQSKVMAALTKLAPEQLMSKSHNFNHK